ncbi:MAG: hypothetical protein IR158_18045 [Cellulomonas sp.]|uniref:hypothetical protein n=1 Tax=Cellulomonas sp. TaxID=40001 RepID=UPI0019E9B87B|nr:hypothetical protein [Cellulomonas sp.]MBF0689657.1 hypothetical protein [Cellulomonas sp.]
MRSTPKVTLTVGALLVGVAWALAACSGGDAPAGPSGTPPGTQPSDGTGHLEVSDLEDPPQPGHFTAEPTTVVARLGVTPGGCVTVEVDGVERLPFWPSGTQVEEDPDDLGSYVVTLPDGTSLRTGDSFEAAAVVDDALAFGEESQPPGKVATLVDFCAVDAAPVAFFDATTIHPPVD